MATSVSVSVSVSESDSDPASGRRGLLHWSSAVSPGGECGSLAAMSRVEAIRHDPDERWASKLVVTSALAMSTRSLKNSETSTLEVTATAHPGSSGGICRENRCPTNHRTPS